MTPRPERLLHDGLFARAAEPAFANKAAVVVEGKPYTYAELRDAVVRLASALRAHGVERGDRVAIYMDNTWPCVVSLYATLAAGGVFLIVNPQTKSDKLEFILDDSGAKVLLTDGHLAHEFVPVLAKNAKLEAVIASGTLPEGRDIIAFDDALRDGATTLAPSGTIPLDLAALIYTSGSTGNPKGVMQTHQSMVFAGGSLIEYIRLSSSDVILVMLPLAFDYGLYQLLMAIRLGATLVIERSFTYPAQVFQRMEQFGVTVFPGVPTVYALVLAAHTRTPLSFPNVTRVTNTAAALPDDFVTRLHEVFPNALIYKMYGLTECKRVSYLEPELADSKPGSVGKAIPGTEIYLLNPDGTPTPRGETGILYVRGPHVMLGYWNRPDLTDHMLKPGKYPGERVLCTQDHFRMDADGFLYFVGRTDDIIKTRGEKVSPAEVENAMHGIDGIREVAVIGVPDEVLGQSIRAYVVLKPGATLTDKQLRVLSAQRLENFMVPKDIVIVDDLPKTTTGKVSKKLLLEQATRG
ncbi:MAG TPA: class I adenylate-forming enzyme family protein [Rhodanobacteraceae bacterium]|nr:class I adenylate-forming enzyme family protein [Rhodanobacteraceae bacterium]